MSKLKVGDLCEIIAISKTDSYYRDRKKFIGKKFLFIEQEDDNLPWHHGGGFIECHLKPEIEIKTSERTISGNEVVSFLMVKLKKV